MHMREILGSTVEIFVIGVFDWPTHVYRCMDIDAVYPCSSLRADSQIETEEALPATSAGELEMIITPEETGCLVVDLAACTQKSSRHLFANVFQTLLVPYFEPSN